MEHDFNSPEYNEEKRQALISTCIPGIWYSLQDYPLKQCDFLKVVGFSPDWIHPDFNPDGTRECFINGDLGWTSAKWWDYQDCYVEDEETSPTHFMLYYSTEAIMNN